MPTPPFTPTRALLNPKFDGYKLDTAPHAQSSVSLPYPLSQTAKSGTLLTFQEVQSRIRHNHLTVWPEGEGGEGEGRAVYVDEEMRVVGISIGVCPLSLSLRDVY